MTTVLPGRKAIATALGFEVKEGRGRMARDVAAAVDKAIADGRYAVEVKVPTRVKVKPADKPVKPVRQVRQPVQGVLEPAPMTWPEGTRAVEVESGRERSMRECCQNCGVSLNWCQCHLRPVRQSPTIVSSSGAGPVAIRLEV